MKQNKEQRMQIRCVILSSRAFMENDGKCTLVSLLNIFLASFIVIQI